jgi:tryptophan synthase alpha chain
VRRLTDLPVGVGFGVSAPEQAAWIAGLADAVIVGSALARLLEDGDRTGAPARVARFLAGLKAAMLEAVPARVG